MSSKEEQIFTFLKIKSSLTTSVKLCRKPFWIPVFPIPGTVYHRGNFSGLLKGDLRDAVTPPVCTSLADYRCWSWIFISFFGDPALLVLSQHNWDPSKQSKAEQLHFCGISGCCSVIWPLVFVLLGDSGWNFIGLQSNKDPYFDYQWSFGIQDVTKWYLVETCCCFLCWLICLAAPVMFHCSVFPAYIRSEKILQY